MSEEGIKEAKSIWTIAAVTTQDPPSLLEMIQLQHRTLQKEAKWTAFWRDYVEFEGGAGEHIPRHVWVHDLLNAINQVLAKNGYIFAFPMSKMRRCFMYWIWALSKDGWKAPTPWPHDRHRNKAEDFDAFDYVLGFSEFWMRIFDTWKTVDMNYNDYGDALKGQLELFVYCHIDTVNSTAIQEADAFAAALAAAEAGQDEDGRRGDDKKRNGDSYYQDAGYYRGNRDYT